VSNNNDVDIAQLYYKKNRCKTVVKLTGDQDIKSLLDNYPMKRVGANKLLATMYIEVDLKGEPLIDYNRFFGNTINNYGDSFVWQSSKVATVIIQC